MRARTAAALLAIVLLHGCQPPSYRVLAALERGALIFAVRGSGTWPFRNERDVYADRVIVRAAGDVVWAIEAHIGCRREGPTPPFPLVYGRVPPCYREVVPSQPLAENALYLIRGESDLRDGSGWFRIAAGAAVNLEWEEVEGEVRSWSDLPDPGPLSSS